MNHNSLNRAADEIVKSAGPFTQVINLIIYSIFLCKFLWIYQKRHMYSYLQTLVKNNGEFIKFTEFQEEINKS